MYSTMAALLKETEHFIFVKNVIKSKFKQKSGGVSHVVQSTAEISENWQSAVELLPVIGIVLIVDLFTVRRSKSRQN